MHISELTAVAAFAAVIVGCSRLERALNPSCISDSIPQREALHEAYVLARDSKPLSLPAIDSVAVAIISSDSLCRSASIAAFGAEHHQRVVLVALGTSGYLVFALRDQARDRDLRCFTVILDRRLNRTFGICDAD